MSPPDDHVDIYPGDDSHPVVYDAYSLDNELDDLYERLKVAANYRNFPLIESIVKELRQKVYLKVGEHNELL